MAVNICVHNINGGNSTHRHTDLVTSIVADNEEKTHTEPHSLTTLMLEEKKNQKKNSQKFSEKHHEAIHMFYHRDTL